jgi:hypothetical protein
MARTIHQIKQELEYLEDNVATLAEDLRAAYQKYLHSLAQSSSRQLILACYQICTRHYPQAFLRLSVNQREKLQQTLQTIGSKIETSLLSCLQNSLPEVSDNNISEGEESSEEVEIKEPELIKNPEVLFTWYLTVERGIDRILKEVSQQVNKLLIEQDIFPQKFPAKLFEIALKAEEKSSISVGTPNLFNLLIEKNKEGEEQGKRVEAVTAIKLRLSEIEFADSNLDGERGQIRSLLSKIENIREQYRIKQGECAIAEAEAAWRAVWYEN